MIYLATDAHHMLFEGLSGSFNLIPLPFVAVTPALNTDMVAFFSQSFFMVFQIAAASSVHSQSTIGREVAIARHLQE